MKSINKRALIRTGSVLLIVAGSAVSGFALYDLTGRENEAAVKQQADAETPFVGVADDSGASSETDAPDELSPGSLEVGEVFAKLRAPRLGKDYVRNIAQGTSVDRVLNTVGIGHYVKTAMPGEVGNFAIAAHRAGNGGPFRNIDKFVEGDRVTIETAGHTYVYKYLATKIVAPDAVEVISPLPTDVAALMPKAPEARLLTLTTCTPIYINTQRLVVWFALESSQAN